MGLILHVHDMISCYSCLLLLQGLPSNWCVDRHWPQHRLIFQPPGVLLGRADPGIAAGTCPALPRGIIYTARCQHKKHSDSAAAAAVAGAVAVPCGAASGDAEYAGPDPVLSWCCCWLCCDSPSQTLGV